MWPRKGHLRSNNDVMRSMYVFAYNFWLKWDRDVGYVLKCSPCPDASTDMQHDLVRSHFHLDLRSKNEVDLLRSPYICIVGFVSMTLRRWYLYYCSTYKIEKLFAVKYFAQKQLFGNSGPLEAKPLTLGQKPICGEFNYLSNAVSDLPYL